MYNGFVKEFRKLKTPYASPFPNRIGIDTGAYITSVLTYPDRVNKEQRLIHSPKT